MSQRMALETIRQSEELPPCPELTPCRRRWRRWGSRGGGWCTRSSSEQTLSLKDTRRARGCRGQNNGCTRRSRESPSLWTACCKGSGDERDREQKGNFFEKKTYCMVLPDSYHLLLGLLVDPAGSDIGVEDQPVLITQWTLCAEWFLLVCLLVCFFVFFWLLPACTYLLLGSSASHLWHSCSSY